MAAAKLVASAAAIAKTKFAARERRRRAELPLLRRFESIPTPLSVLTCVAASSGLRPIAHFRGKSRDQEALSNGFIYFPLVVIVKRSFKEIEYIEFHDGRFEG